MKLNLFRSLCLTLLSLFACSVNAASLSPGDLVITEVFANPDGADSTQAEFFEIFNTTSDPINLNGLSFAEDDGDNEAFTVVADVFVAPGEFFVIAPTDAPGLGFDVDLNYNDETVAVELADGAITALNGDVFGTGFFAVGNGGDEIRIIEGDLEGVFSEIFSYTTTDNAPFGSGVSIELSDIAIGLDGVVGEDDFVASTTPLGVAPADDLASPGAAGNTVVPEPASALLASLCTLALAGSRRRR